MPRRPQRTARSTNEARNAVPRTKRAAAEPRAEAVDPTESPRKKKGELTRKRILEAALGLFRKQGFDETNMREIAAAAGLSLGAAYYYFPSKEAIVLGYYADVQGEREERARSLFARTSDVRERLRGIIHASLDSVEKDRRLLGALFRGVGDPASALGPFAAETRAVRDGNVALFAEAIGPSVSSAVRPVLARALWLLQLGLLLQFIHDKSPKQARTRKLVDGVVDLLAPLLPLIASPAMAALRERVVRLLDEAGLAGG
jgi:AcrR family transcriptional regulator